MYVFVYFLFTPLRSIGHPHSLFISIVAFFLRSLVKQNLIQIDWMYVCPYIRVGSPYIREWEAIFFFTKYGHVVYQTDGLNKYFMKVIFLLTLNKIPMGCENLKRAPQKWNLKKITVFIGTKFRPQNASHYDISSNKVINSMWLYFRNLMENPPYVHSRCTKFGTSIRDILILESLKRIQLLLAKLLNSMWIHCIPVVLNTSFTNGGAH